ncbi:MAG: type I-E CRISPR-associated protein Cas7/Cse4/CasC [Chloroflexi bacterium]|nr:type I-E CRISPR-associated protein Cas7/Cse4/CasC [Chloroflexota bacterium]
MFIEIHFLQNFAPSNLNRDDTGNPKDTEFGGVRRARISSQCIKRSIRFHPIFAQTTAVDPAIRTRWMTRELAKAFEKAGKPEEQANMVADGIAQLYCKMDKGHTSVLVYMSSNELRGFSSKAIERWDEITSSLKEGKSPALDELAKEMFKTLKDRTSAPDIALFGRMLAEKPELNIDAACQVAHAISTHRVSMEMDFYTAVDDLSKDEETGAGMMGVTAFNSACFYRYARLDWDLLVNNLGGDRDLACRAVEAFLRAALLAVPTGKQTGFAAQNLPDFVLGVSRTDGQSWSLANAFEKPVRIERDGGYLLPSIAALDAYWGRLSKAYGGDGMKTYALCLQPDARLDNLKDSLAPHVEKWIASLVASLPVG